MLVLHNDSCGRKEVSYCQDQQILLETNPTQPLSKPNKPFGQVIGNKW
jgi:negative regulator of replication initiation